MEEETKTIMTLVGVLLLIFLFISLLIVVGDTENIGISTLLIIAMVVIGVFLLWLNKK